MVFDLLPPATLALALLIAFLAGFVKGAVGFAMPLVMISGLSVIMDPRLALAGLVVPTVASNLLQVARAGKAEAVAAIRGFWRFILAVCVMVFISAQLVTAIPPQAMYLALGIPVLAMTLLLLSGLRFSIPARARLAADIGIGGLAGAIGGISGVWGPPTVLYLLALDTPKARQMAVQGVVYGLGAVVLLVGHLRSGVLNAETLPFSILLLLPAGLGMWVGFQTGDRLDAARFRRWTLVVLTVAGANLIRRGLMG